MCIYLWDVYVCIYIQAQLFFSWLKATLMGRHEWIWSDKVKEDMQNTPELLFLINHQRSVTSFKPLIRAPLSSLKRGIDWPTPVEGLKKHLGYNSQWNMRSHWHPSSEKLFLPTFLKEYSIHSRAQTTDLSLSPIIRKQPWKQHITKSFQILFLKPAHTLYPEQAVYYICLHVKISSSP